MIFKCVFSVNTNIGSYGKVALDPDGWNQLDGKKNYW